jgi:uncharacterized Zn-binding protein involved in type VI secretion
MGMPAARIGDVVTCVGPPGVVALGSATVMIGMPAARLGDMTGHGSTIWQDLYDHQRQRLHNRG